MAYFKPINGHTLLSGKRHCQEYLESYLEKGDRPIGKDFLNLRPDQEVDWAKIMDKTRAENGNDSPKGNYNATTYRHFIISPDPRDNIDLDTLRTMTMEWAEQQFGCEGKIGCYQVAVIYHDDNKNHIPHAHVVVNNTNFNDGGKRFQLSNTQNKQLRIDLQVIAKKHGLCYFESNTEDTHSYAADIHSRDLRPSAQKIYKNKAEKEMEAKGIITWKQEIRDYVIIASELSSSPDDFKKRLEDYGLKVEEKTDKHGNIDYVYTHPSGGKKIIYGNKLGTLFTPSGVLDTIQSSWFRKQAEKHHGEFPGAISIFDAIVDYQTIGVKHNSVSLHEIGTAVRVISDKEIGTLEWNDRLIKRTGVTLRRAKTPQESRIKGQELAELIITRKVAERMNLIPAGNRETETISTNTQSEPQSGGKTIPISEKVKKGLRMSKNELDNLTEQQRTQWMIARKNKGKSNSSNNSAHKSDSSKSKSSSSSKKKSATTRKH